MPASRQARWDRACGQVDTAIPEWAEPGIGDGLLELAAKGKTENVAAPCFLVAATHAAQDIPKAIAGFSALYPGVRVRVTPHLGASSSLPATIVNVAA
jgi:sirohydrochlorin ferrochelatase